MLFIVGCMLILSFTTIDLVQGCPDRCICKETTVECNDLALTRIPDNIPSNTTQLLLDSNSITKIESNAFSGLTSLVVLFLDTNNITSIEQNVFSDLLSLDELYLLYNPFVCCSMTGFVNWVKGTSYLVYGFCTDFNSKTAIRIFNISNCIVPVGGGWSDWNNSTCSATCGNGTVTRNRTCNSPAPSDGGNNCSGVSIETKSCNQGECPESGSTAGTKSDNKSGKGSDNKSGKKSDNKSGKGSDDKSGKGSDTDSGKGSDNDSGMGSDNKSGKWSDNKSGGKKNEKKGRKQKRT